MQLRFYLFRRLYDFPGPVILQFQKTLHGSVKNPTMSDWQQEKQNYLSLTLEEKREFYKCKKYIKLEDIQTWKDYAQKFDETDETHQQLPNLDINNSLNDSLCAKVSVFTGDITTLEIDAIVNAANNTLLGGGGVDGAIHRGAGPNLKQECRSLNGCETGYAKISGAYTLPAKYVIHTVGPVGEKPGLLQQCYRNCLNTMKENKLRSIAFPCISTGIYGYPVEPAAYIAIGEARKFLEEHHDQIDRIIFCIFMQEDLVIYENILKSYFPLA